MLKYAVLLFLCQIYHEIEGGIYRIPLIRLFRSVCTISRVNLNNTKQSHSGKKIKIAQNGMLTNQCSEINQVF